MTEHSGQQAKATYLLSCNVTKLWLIIGQIFASERGVPHFNVGITINDISLKTTFFGLQFLSPKVSVYLQPLLRNAPRKLPNSVK